MYNGSVNTTVNQFIKLALVLKLKVTDCGKEVLTIQIVNVTTTVTCDTEVSHFTFLPPDFTNILIKSPKFMDLTTLYHKSLDMPFETEMISKMIEAHERTFTIDGPSV